MSFLKQALKRPIWTGAIAPSSKYLANYIADLADLEHKKVVVELGPGSGVFTKEIIRKNKGLFFALEINEEFVNETKKNCPEAIVYHDSATEIKKYLKKHKKSHCDCIISALPWTLFDHNLQKELLDSVYNSLEKDGEFFTIAYLSGLYLPHGLELRKILNEKFREVKKSKIVWRNLPPTIVYCCKK